MSGDLVLVVDDDFDTRRQIDWCLRDDYRVLLAGDADEARRAVLEQPLDAVVLDLHLPPDASEIRIGLELLEWIRDRKQDVPVIVMTGDRERATALRCVERGAFDFLEKPTSGDELRVILARALRMRHLEAELVRLREAVTEQGALARLVGTSPAMEAVRARIRKVADTKCTVLIRGESGTGKELVARALHELSGRRRAPFLALNCSAIPQTLVEAELFGHERGAYTGAHERRLGRFERASGGTLFLDEVGDLALETQARLLRVLQESELERLGGHEVIRVDVRVVAATHQDLEAMVRAGKFRADLLYRLKVVEIATPALRDRRPDIPLLADAFLRRYGRGRIGRISRDALGILCAAPWPGNVRELEHAIERACVLCEGNSIGPIDLPPELGPPAGGAERIAIELPAGGLSLAEVERDLVRQALERTNWNQSKAAKLLGVTRAQLIQRMRRHGLGAPAEG